ncbi:unnamed protein product [Clonostachys chloroleuca]|uniref:Uncharacterized protein n=1 Tax=Clonostachys chloroleuca TaxID=1926264 RepID=A0AA35MBT7_9HYPO|nr:unnamed protein product [Clonostachys chloroleuca]
MALRPGIDDESDEPWDVALRLRPVPAETWSSRIEESIEKPCDNSRSKKQTATWKDGLLPAHMANCHCFDAVTEGRRYLLPSIGDSTLNERIDFSIHSYQFLSPMVETRVTAFDQKLELTSFTDEQSS